MNSVVQAFADSRHLLSGNEAVARAVWEAGVKVAAAYPGTPSTEILENIALYPDVYSEWSTNEKVALEVAIGASVVGSRSFCAMKHVGMNVASDALMSITLAGVGGGLVIVVTDDVGVSSSQNEQDSRFWGRFAHVPILEPADSQEACDMTRAAYDISEACNVPVIVRMTTRICHVKALVTIGDRQEHPAPAYARNTNKWVMVPENARAQIPQMFVRDEKLRKFSEQSELNIVESGADKSFGFICSGPAYMHVRESFPAAPILKLGFSYPLPLQKVKKLALEVDQLVVVEETAALVENELKAEGFKVSGKQFLPTCGELLPNVLQAGIRKLQGEKVEIPSCQVKDVFPRPPTMCVACPHLGPYLALSRMKNVIVAGDIGCYTLGAGHPWNALDTTVAMGASMGMALGMDKGRSKKDEKKNIVAVIGDSTFLHMGMQGLVDLVYNRGNVTVLLLDNRTVGMTGGQDHAGTGRDIHGEESPRIDFVQLVAALGVRKDRIRTIDPYELPTVFKTIREEVKHQEPSVIITDRPCVLIDHYKPKPAFTVKEESCTGCGNCLDVGCPAIFVTRRQTVTKPNGQQRELAFVGIESAVCTGCELCVKTCGPDAIVAVTALGGTQL